MKKLILLFLLQFGGLSPQLWAQAWDSRVEPTVAYDVTFSGTTTFSGAVSFSGTVTFTGTSALWTADGDTVRIDPGTALDIIDVEVNDSKVFVVDTTGAVGINTATPTRNLHIHETTSGLNYLKLTNSTTGNTVNDGLEFGLSSAENAVFWMIENKAIRFATNNIARMRIDNDGDIGIGTSSPDEKLHIDDSGGTDGTGRWLANASVSTSDATTTTIYTLATTTARMYRLFVNVSANRNDGSAVMATSWSFVVKNVGGTVTELQDAVIGTEFDDSAGVSISGAVSGTDYLIQVTGIAAQTWNWEVSIDATIVAQ